MRDGIKPVPYSFETMITYIIPSYSNPEGLRNTILSIRENAFTEGAEVIVLLESGDTFLNDMIEVCADSRFAPMQVHNIVFQTPSLSAKVNHAVMCARTPFVTVVNDDIILSFSAVKAEDRVRSIASTYPDLLLLLYPSTQGNQKYPIVSKKFVDLAGYLYHPICVGIEMSERWLGSIFFDLDRAVQLEIKMTRDAKFPTKIGVDDEAKTEAEILFSKTGKIRRYTSTMISNFML